MRQHAEPQTSSTLIDRDIKVDGAALRGLPGFVQDGVVLMAVDDLRDAAEDHDDAERQIDYPTVVAPESAFVVPAMARLRAQGPR